MEQNNAPGTNSRTKCNKFRSSLTCVIILRTIFDFICLFDIAVLGEKKFVTNTPWGERVYFDFDPGSDLVTKTMHVSPFMDMLGNWTMKVNSPGDDLSVSVMVQHPDLGAYFTATLRANRIPASMVSDPTLFFWLMPQKAALWTYWQAFKLWWKGVPFIQHPRYLNQAYREEALLRDQILRCCKPDKAEFGVPCSKDDQQRVKARGFIWREAKWPWC